MDNETNTTTEVEEEVSNDPSETKTPTADAVEDPKFTRRRKVRGVIVAVVIAVAVLFGVTRGPGGPGNNGPLADTPAGPGSGQLAEAVTEPVPAVAGDPVNEAAQHAASVVAGGGTLDGWRPLDPSVGFAAAGRSAVVSGLVDGVCHLSGVEDGVLMEVRSDPTNTACSDAELVAAQQQLDMSALADASVNTADLDAAVAAVQDWPRFTADATGRPTFTGVPTPAGATAVVSPDGQAVTVTVGSGPNCAAATVTVYSTVTNHPC